VTTKTTKTGLCVSCDVYPHDGNPYSMCVKCTAVRREQMITHYKSGDAVTIFLDDLTASQLNTLGSASFNRFQIYLHEPASELADDSTYEMYSETQAAISGHPPKE
jgi:hypothetical protein